uniref:Neurotransmitter-gated ion-channel transmembrane domain-containing protein n=1 Tax=Oncorhynchus mykiss TaxID=8022 RepID=A0A8C7LL01_ONCMY
MSNGLTNTTVARQPSTADAEGRHWPMWWIETQAIEIHILNRQILIGMFVLCYLEFCGRADILTNTLILSLFIALLTASVTIKKYKTYDLYPAHGLKLSPYFTLFYSMDENRAPIVPYVYIKHTGIVRDANPVRVVSSCNLEIYIFPFDVQNCTFTFRSYIHHGKTSMQPCFRTYLNVRIVLRRRATLYVVNLLIPSCFLITVDLFSFLLPPQNVDRSSFKMTLILGYSVFLLIVNDLLPVTGSTIPLINVFFAICLALMVASLLETILITNLLVASCNFPPVPGWVRVLVLRFMGTLVWLPQKSREDKIIFNPVARVCPLVLVERQVQTGEPGKMWSKAGDPALAELRNLGNELQSIRLQVAQHVDGNQISQDWMQVGYIIDRLLFGIYCIFITFSFIIILSIWSNSYNQ